MNVLKTNRNSLVRKMVAIGLLIVFTNVSLAQNVHQKEMSEAKRMGWWQKARFGMFIHWGIYSVPAGFYKGEAQKNSAEWIMNQSKIPIAEYEKFASEFNPKDFDPKTFVGLAKEAGMKYIVITSKHYDGFSMFDSESNPFNIVNATPFERDILKELAKECQEQGLKFGFYYSQAQDWHHPGGLGNDWDESLQRVSSDDYLHQKAIPEVKQLLTDYGPISIFWWDTPRDMNKEVVDKLYRMTTDLQPEIITNDRLGDEYPGNHKTYERRIPIDPKEKYWEVCMPISGSWGYRSDDKNFKSDTTLIRNLVDIASKGGNYLLNVSPTAQGTLAPETIERLKTMGNWLGTNGESIYGSNPSPYDHPEWGRYTAKRGLLYAHVFDPPEERKIVIDKSVKVIKAWILGDEKNTLKIDASRNGDAVLLPNSETDPFATVLKLEVIPADDWANLNRYSKTNEQVQEPDPEENRVVFMGNSITEKWVKYVPEFFESNPYIGRGISGQTTAQMLLRFRPDVVALNPEVVVIHAGTNDIAANRGPTTVEEIAGNLFSMAELAQANKIKVVLASVLPATSYSWRPAIDPADDIIRLNEMIEAYAKSNGIIYLDYYSPMVNDVKGLKKEYGRDTVHPNIAGYKVMEGLANKAIKKALKK